MTLEEFMVREKMTRTFAESESYCYYNRVQVNGEYPRSPFMHLTEGDSIRLVEYDTNTMEGARILEKIYKENI